MSIFWIKIVAVLTMLIDHIGAFAPIEGWEYWRMIGRISFPLFAFMLAQGFIYTHSRAKYLLRIAVLAVLTQPIYTYCFYDNWFKWDALNILFTLSAGLGCMWLLELGKRTVQKHGKRGIWLGLLLCVATGALVLLAELAGVDYGWEGVLLLLLFYMTAEHKWAWCPIVILFAFRNQLLTGNWTEPVYQRCIFGGLAFIPLVFYNGKPGPRPKNKALSAVVKYGFYAFYPLHLLVLAMIFR